jgi:hypothetical protein
VYVNSSGNVFTANVSRGDVNSAFNISGSHGFDATVSAPAGATVCAFAISVTGGTNTTVGCRTI